MEILKEFQKRNIICLFSTLLLSYVSIISLCEENEGEPSTPEGKPVDTLFCEDDAMDGYGVSYDYIDAELYRATSGNDTLRDIYVMNDNLNLDPSPEVFEITDDNDPLYQYLAEHRTVVNEESEYPPDSKMAIYVCGVRKIKVSGVMVEGKAYWDEDTSVHNEGMAAVAVEQIQEDCFGDRPYYKVLCSVTAHEIGHLFNMEHCSFPTCIMYTPLDLWDPPDDFCNSHLNQLETEWP